MPKVKKSAKTLQKPIPKGKSTEDAIYDDFYPEALFSESLENTFSLFLSQKSSDLEALTQVLSATHSYLEHRAGNVQNPATERLHEIFRAIYYSLAVPYFDKKRATENNTMALGGFIELLIYFGMPRLPAIEAVSAWQKISKTKARKANEVFRSRYLDIIADKNRFKAHIMFGKYRDTHLSWQGALGKFPCDHPKAKNAYQAAYELIEMDIFSKSTEILKQMKRQNANALKILKKEIQEQDSDRKRFKADEQRRLKLKKTK